MPITKVKGAVWDGSDNGQVVSAKDYGIALDGVTDDSSAFQSLLNSSIGKRIYVGKGTLRLLSKIDVPSGTIIDFSGCTVQAGTQTYIFDLSSSSSSVFLFGSILGDGVTAAQTAFRIKNSSYNKFYGVFVSSCLNKGFEVSAQTSLSETSKENEFFSCKVSGATGATGAGLSLFGDAATRNKVVGGSYSSNRIGVTLNGCLSNAIESVTADDNTQMGITIDGIVTASGDGGKYNTISGCHCNGNLGASYAGIYIGNGSSYNSIIGCVGKGNSGAGLRFSAGVGYECLNNRVVGCSFSSNASNGISMSRSHRNEFVSCYSSGNTGRGISCFSSDYTKIISGNFSSNTTDGILVQSGYSRIVGVEAYSNGGYGIRVTTGGSADSSGNRISQCLASGNTTANYGISSGGLGRIYDSAGYSSITTDAGDANITYTLGATNTIVYNTPITAARTVTLSTTNAIAGDRVRVTRTAACTGAFNINVGTGPLKALSVIGSWCDVEFNGSAWVLVAYGTL